MTNLYEKRNISDLENRLRLLLCLSELGMVSREMLWPFVAKLELMEYMQMCVYLEQLLSDQLIGQGTGRIGGMLYLTEKGEERLRLLLGSIPASHRERIADKAPGYLSSLRENMTARAAYELPDAGYACKCIVTEDDVPSLIVLVQSESKQLVERIAQRFRKNAAAITLRLLALCPQEGALSEKAAVFPGDDPEKALRAAEAGKPNLCRLGGEACAGAVCLQGETILLRFSLRMPTEKSARQWIYRMENGDEAFFATLTKLMAGPSV